MSYLKKRIALYLFAAWVTVSLNFLIPRLMPGDPASALFARFQGKLKPEALDALKKSLGLSDAPLIEQYVDYWQQLFSGQFGVSIAFHPTPVIDVMSTGFVWTLGLCGIAVLISFVIGTLLGALCAWRPNGFTDAVAPTTSAILSAFPYFWMAMILVYVLGLQLELFPLGMAHGPYSAPGFNFEFLYDIISHGFLPCLTVVIASVSGWLFVMRNTMIGIMGSEFICLAHAKGLPRKQILFKYAIRNALLPSFTSFGMAIGFIVGGSLLTEVVFSYPGQGYLLVKAVLSQDFPLMQGLFLVITLSVLVANFLVDLLYVLLDPRTREDRS